MKKKIFSIVICLALLGNCLLSCICPVTVLALSAGGLQSTIASIIISLMLECGVAPVNNTWLQTLNSSYGVTSSIGTLQDCINSGLLTQTASGLVDSGLSAAIEAAPAYTELGLAEIFTTSADDVALGVVAGSGGFNIATTAINVGTLGTIGAFAGAAAVGVGLGVLINHLRERFFNNADMSAPMIYEAPDSYTNYNNICSQETLLGRNHTRFICTDEGMYVVGFIRQIDSASGLPYDYGYIFINKSDVTKHYYTYVLESDSSWVSTNVTASQQYRVAGSNLNQRRQKLIKSSIDMDNTYDEALDITNKILNDELSPEEITNYSPDLIGDEGNQRIIDGDMNLKNVVPDGYDMKPVDMNDYMNYSDTANDNTDNEDVGQPVQGVTFDNLIDSLLVSPSIIPDQGITDPDVPDRPIIPDQPEVPGKDPITGEQQSEVLEGITTPDLRSVFPFCIPFDLYALLGNLKYESREAPVIVWEFEFLGNSYPVIIDLSPYDEAAEILRLCELFLFIVGLAVNTRRLIGAGG